MMRTYRSLPSLPAPVVLEDWRFSIVRPIARTNLVTNPSVETATTGWAVTNGSIARSTTYAYHGAYSLAVTAASLATDGAYYGTVSLTSGTTYAASIKFYAPNDAGKPYRIAFATTAGVMLQSVEFRATGFWQWVSVLWTETSTTTRRIYITKNGSTAQSVYYLDGLQVEACETGNYWPTTYIDGDQQGLLGAVELPPYYWTGTPHASTSVRSGQTRAGGRVVPLARYGLHITSAQGLGLAPVQPITTPFAQLDGSQFLDIRKQSRPVTLAGRWGALTPAAKERQIAALAADLDRDLIATRQPLTILAEPMQGGKPLRAPIAIPGLSYVGGLEGDLTGLPTEESIISFTQYQPRISAGERGAALDVQDSLNEAAVLRRSREGVWSIPGSPFAEGGIAYAMATAPSGTIYVGGDGDFTLSDASTLAAVAQLSGDTWSGLSTGMATATQVFALAIAPDGRLYAGGGFTTAGGVGANRIAVWDGSAWSALGTGMNGIVRGIAFAPDGTLYAVGDFTTAGGGGANRIATWDGSTWSALGTGFDASAQAVAVGPDGRVYAGGNFTTAGGNAALAVAVWDGSTWSAMGVGLNQVRSLVFGLNGILYAGGAFTIAGGYPANRVAAWNGSAWSAMGDGIAGTTVYQLAIDRATGLLYAVGVFTAADGHPATHYAVWNGSSWTSGDFQTTSAGGIGAVGVGGDGALYIGAQIIGAFTTVVAAASSVTNGGSTASYPRLTITGPASGTGTFLYLANTTTGATIYADMLVFAGETVVIDFRPDTFSVTSTTQGNRLSTILPGSNATGFFLQPGVNTIACLCDDGTMTAVLSWATDLASLTDGWTR
jgi:hypothetical protein